MYTPFPFRIDDLDTLHRFIREHSFATLITPAKAGLQITHLPLLIDRLAMEGIVFDRAYHMGASSGAVCVPSQKADG